MKTTTSVTRSFIFLFVLCLAACKKDNNSSQSAVASLSFKANGTLYTWGGSTSDTSSTVTAIYRDASGLYSLGGIDLRNNGYNKLSFDITSSALQTTVYAHKGAGKTGQIGECTLGTLSNSTNYWNSAVDDSISVTITSVDNGYFNGTFKGSITRNGGTEKLSITDGQFQRLKIINE
ncbi:MAG: hypothetical protein J0H74_34965 [Chitinophagaceae bacterium]|nr:hypothetical protein [Chitinophagaceae bacterium]